MIQLSYADLLLTVIALSMVVIVVYLAVLGRRIERALGELEEVRRALLSVMPRLNDVAREAQETLRASRRLAERAEGIGVELEAIVTRARRTTDPLFEEVDRATSSLRQVSALIAGVKAAWGALHRTRGAGEENQKGRRR